MKKILMTMVAAFIAVSASAQVFVGGSLGIGVSKAKGGESKTTYVILPEVGYNFNDDWAVGTMLGWGKGNPVSLSDATTESVRYFSVAPYVRYTFLHSKYVNLFVDGGFDYTHYNGGTNIWEIGAKPGVAINLNNHFSFLAKIGFVGWINQKNSDANLDDQAWGASFDNNHLSFGLYYNF